MCPKKYNHNLILWGNKIDYNQEMNTSKFFQYHIPLKKILCKPYESHIRWKLNRFRDKKHILFIMEKKIFAVLAKIAH